MPLNPSRPIRPPGWAFSFSLLQPQNLFFAAHSLVVLGLLLCGFVMKGNPVLAQPAHADDAAGHTAASGHDHSVIRGGWEGSAKGIAYSEFNHHVAGILLLIIGCAELSQVLRVSSPLWARLLLPGALGVMGIFLLVWSDHDAWPIGSLSLSDTLYGGDPEILQHKLYGVLAVVTAAIEALRRTGRISRVGWMVPLPAFAIVGGWMLFGHAHGAHPSAAKIAFHHAIMGALAISAGFSRFVSAWKAGASIPAHSRWELLWAVLLIVIGLQLILYSE